MKKNKKPLTRFYPLAGGIVVIVLIAGAVHFSRPNSASQESPSSQKQQASKVLNMAQIPFVENVGQTNPEVKYISQLMNGTFYVSGKGELTYSFAIQEKEKNTANQDSMIDPHPQRLEENSKGYAIKERFVTDKTITPSGIDQTNANINYFIGKDESQWQKNVRNFRALDLGEVFEGITAKLQVHGRNVEKIFTVEKNRNPENIKIALAGVDHLSVHEGELKLSTPEGTLNFTKPVAYQMINGQKKIVDAQYKIFNDQTYGFTVGDYDKTRELIIDPLLATTYVGGTAWEGEKEVLGGNTNMVISGGSIYLSAYTYSADFPVTAGTYQNSRSGTNDAFVSKFSLNLGTLEASTFLGGTGGEAEVTLTADPTGNIFVLGNTTSTDFPGTIGHYQETKSGTGQHVFIAKLNSGLTSLLAATYLGGTNTGAEWGNAIITDSLGYVYVAVDARGGYPVTPVGASAGFDTTLNAVTTIAISKLDNNLSPSYYTATFIGSNNFYGALAIDSSGDVLVTGGRHGTSTSGPVTGPVTSPSAPGLTDGTFPVVRTTAGVPSFQESQGSSWDSFVARFSGDLTTLKATTLIGGPNIENDFTETIAVRGSGANEEIFLIGDSSNTNSTANGGLLQALEGNPNTIDNNASPTSKVATFGPLSDTTPSGDDVYVAKFNADLTQASVAILGGTDTDNIPFLSLNSAGQVYLTLDTYSTDFPTTSGAYAVDPGDNNVDIIGAKLSNDLSTLLGSTYIPGSAYDNYPGAIAVDETLNAENVYINAETETTNLPGASNGAQPTNAGAGDLFITEFNCDFAAVCPPTGLTGTPADSQVVLNWTAPAANDVPITDYEVHYSTDNFATVNLIFTDPVSTATTATVTGLINGTPYAFYVKAQTGAGNFSPPSNTANVTPGLPGTIPDAITDLAGTPGDSSATLTWTAPNDGGQPITGYTVRYGENTGASACDPTTSPYTNCSSQASGTTSVLVNGLTNDTTYIFAVYAENVFGFSAASNTVTITPSVAANCPGLTSTETCSVSRISSGGLTFADIPDNTAFTNAQNNTSLPSYNNASGTDAQDIMSVSDLRDDPLAGFEVQLEASSPFATSDNLNFIPLQYLYVASSLPRVAGTTDDEAEGIEYAAGCFGSTNNITSSVNVPEPRGPGDLGILSTFTTSGSGLGNGNITVPVVLMSSPASQRRCTMSEAISYAIDLPSYITALGTNIPPGTYSVTFTYTLISL